MYFHMSQAKISRKWGFRSESVARFLTAIDLLNANEIPDASLDVEKIESERRQVTVLFADLSGFTTMTNALDAEETHAILNRFFTVADGIVDDYGGRIDKHIGDAVMAVFGAPIAHGDDPERAVRAALDMHEAVAALEPPLEIHVGIASGQVVASRTGSETHREYTVTGASVNLASRLTDVAAHGETLVSETAQRALSGRVECENLGQKLMLGLPEPVTVWRVRSLATTAREQTQNLVGREYELRRFDDAMTHCREKGRGETLVLRGEPGIGKTRLLAEFRRRAETAGFAAHAGLVLDFGTGKGQDAIPALVRQLIGSTLGSDARARLEIAERAIEDGLLSADRRAHLYNLLDLEQPPALRGLYDAMDIETRNRGELECVEELVRNSHARRPLLLMIEDVHWAYPRVLVPAARLARTVAETTALLVMTSRIEGYPFDDVWQSGLMGAPIAILNLALLAPREASDFARQFSIEDEGLVRACVERSSGNPLFLDQLLRNADALGDRDVPGTVQSVVQARLDALARDDRGAVQSASVLGQRFSLTALRAVLGKTDYEPADLIRRTLVRPEGEDLLFTHALIRDGIYDGLVRERRLDLHGRAAAWFDGRDSILHAEHLELAQDPAAPEAYLVAATSQAAEYRHEVALRLVARGLALATERGDRFALTCFQGRLHHDMGVMADARDAYEAALALADHAGERCQAWLGLAMVKRLTDDREGAMADLARAEAAGRASGANLARIHLMRGNLFFADGDTEGCLANNGTALEIARQCGAVDLEAAALGGLADADYVRGRMISAHTRFAECVTVSRERGFGRIEVANAPMVAITRFFGRNQAREALADGFVAAEAARRVGHNRAETAASVIVSEMLANLGRFAEAKVQIAEGLALAHRLGSKLFETLYLNCQAKVLREEGRPAEALKLLELSLAISREIGLGFSGAVAYGALALTTDDPKARRKALAEGEGVLRAGAVAHNQLRFYRDAIEATLRAEEWDEVERLATALEDFTRPEPLPWANFYIVRGRALAAWGRGHKDSERKSELERLMAEARRAGLHLALPALEAALASY